MYLAVGCILSSPFTVYSGLFHRAIFLRFGAVRTAPHRTAPHSTTPLDHKQCNPHHTAADGNHRTQHGATPMKRTRGEARVGNERGQTQRKEEDTHTPREMLCVP